MSTHIKSRTALRLVTATAVVTAALLAPATAALAVAAEQSHAAQAATGQFTGELRLNDGSTAKVYRLGDRHYRLENLVKGRVIGNLEVRAGNVAAGNHNGYYIALHDDGTVTDWWAKFGDTTVGEGEHKLINGDKVTVTKLADGRYKAAGANWTLETGSSLYSALEVNREAQGEVVVALGKDGSFSSGHAGRMRPFLTPPKEDCTGYSKVGIGAGTEAYLSFSEKDGPEVYFRESGSGAVFDERLDRDHPSLPEDAGFVARIEDPTSKAPKLVTKTQGGDTPEKVTPFPAIPAECVEDGAGAGSGGDDQGQTDEIPQGGVAAGAEKKAAQASAPVDGEDNGMWIAAGGAAAVAAAGLGFVALRRRTAARD